MTAGTPSSERPIRQYRAAGGVVLDDDGRVLVIERWVVRGGSPVFEARLPKGHVEPGETDDQAARREVCEEAGVCRLTVLADLGETVTQFDLPRERVVRCEHYYLMRAGGDEVSAHPVDPDSDEARFVPCWYAGFDDAEERLTYESERDFMRRAQRVFGGSQA
jgi:8-oxo-dGTP pyrophosphatase MutT (NUDIX family)